MDYVLMKFGAGIGQYWTSDFSSPVLLEVKLFMQSKLLFKELEYAPMAAKTMSPNTGYRSQTTICEFALPEL